MLPHDRKYAIDAHVDATPTIRIVAGRYYSCAIARPMQRGDNDMREYRFYVNAQPLNRRFELKSVSFCSNAKQTLASLRPSATKAAVVLMPRALKAR